MQKNASSFETHFRERQAAAKLRRARDHARHGKYGLPHGNEPYTPATESERSLVALHLAALRLGVVAARRWS